MVVAMAATSSPYTVTPRSDACLPRVSTKFPGVGKKQEPQATAAGAAVFPPHTPKASLSILAALPELRG